MHQQTSKNGYRFDPLSANVGDSQLPTPRETEQIASAESAAGERIDWLSANISQVTQSETSQTGKKDQ